jgi:hypothetical protein
VGGSVAALLTTVVVVAQASVTTLRAPAPAPSTAAVPRITTTTAESAACHPSYRPCLPIRTDLDCADIKQKVKVVGPDSYRLDRDGDGWACENYG